MPDTSIKINVSRYSIDDDTIRKMSFIYKAIQDGWTVNLDENKYIFLKKHNGEREVFGEDYLLKFIHRNISL
uniref:Uncharacterized protein n=1 Tax=viral metagenome TaxID=1070528 RepID=A0A6C0BQ74_9ZZZZ